MDVFTRRRLILAGGAGSLAALGSRALAQAYDPLSDVNPELRPMARQMLAAPKGPPLSDATIVAARGHGSSVEPASSPPWREQSIPGRNGAPPVRVFVINAGANGPARPAILHIHGGGYVLGDAKSGIPRLQRIAQALDCVIVTVDYRLAPETRFPGSLEDNYAGLKWLHDNAATLGADRARIAVMGESAGGGHAAMLAIAARDRGEIPLAYQCLIFPMLDDRTGSTRPAPRQMGVFVWTPQKNRYGWSALLGHPAGSPNPPAGSVPARVENLRGLPPAFIGVGSIDLFVDEDITYAKRLIDADVPTTLEVVPGAYHGFDGTHTELAKRFNDTMMAALAAGLAPKAA